MCKLTVSQQSGQDFIELGKLKARSCGLMGFPALLYITGSV